MQESQNKKSGQHLNEVIKYFQGLFPFLSNEVVQALLDEITIKKFHKNEHLIRIGEFNYSIYFVFSGLIRAYYFSDQGHELTPFFWNENLITASWETIYSEKPSSLNFEAIEETTVGMIDFKKMKKMINQHEKLQQAYIAMMESILTNSLVHTQSFIHEKPESRFERFKSDFPDLQKRISQKHMASYLGITPISFSRLKRRLGS